MSGVPAFPSSPSADAPPSSTIAHRVAILCFGFAKDRLHRQPWYTVDGIARGLAAHGVAVTVLTDSRDPLPEGTYAVERLAARASLVGDCAAIRDLLAVHRPEAVLAVGGLGELARLRPLGLSIPIAFLLASPRLRPLEILTLPVGAWAGEWPLLWRPLLGAFLPAFLLRYRLRHSGIARLLYLSPETRERLMARGFPAGPVVVPAARPVCPPAESRHPLPTIGFFGPPLRLRGLDLVLDTYARLRRRGIPVRLRLVLRPDGPGLPRWLVRRLSSLPFAEDVEVVHEHLSPSGLAAALAPVDLFLLPFRVPVSETPLVVPEAALSGRPVVVLDRPGVADMARRLGGVVASTPRELPEAVLRALHEPPVVTVAEWSDWRAATVDLHPKRLLADPPLWRLRLVGLCGPDGSGKTTLARALVERFARQGVPARYRWSRYRNYLSKPFLGAMRLLGISRTLERQGVVLRVRNFRGHPLLARLFLLLQTIDQALDILLSSRFGPSVVADRCLYDTLVDLAAETGLEELVFGRIGPLLERLLPQPRAIVLLERDPAAVRIDRPDVEADPLFAERCRLYRELARRLDLPRIPVTTDVAQTRERLEATLARLLRGERP
ncbi:hypothetical protein HRbin40_00506 [bacterium HR40]|nr:hypothetical protein HRbin40_00506 [bacterium HR40]